MPIARNASGVGGRKVVTTFDPTKKSRSNIPSQADRKQLLATRVAAYKEALARKKETTAKK